MVGCLSTDAVEGSSSSSLSISKWVMLAAALFFGRDLWVRGGSEEKESGADCGAEESEESHLVTKQSFRHNLNYTSNQKTSFTKVVTFGI